MCALGLERMAFEHRKLQQQQRSLEKKMNYFQSHLPNACGIMEDDYEGYRLADELNGVYTPPSGQANYWAKLSSLRAKLPSMLTPAQRLRRKYAQVKSKDLTTAERQWLVLDLTINADKVRVIFDTSYCESSFLYSTHLLTPITKLRGDVVRRWHVVEALPEIQA